jgi:hypothetical protein
MVGRSRPTTGTGLCYGDVGKPSIGQLQRAVLMSCEPSALMISLRSAENQRMNA